MVQSKAATVDAYMETVEPDRRAALDRLRALCKATLDGWEEGMHWGMPGYAPAGQPAVVAFNSQKRTISFYPGPTAVERFRERLAGVDCGKGCIRYPNAARIDFVLVEDILRDVRRREGPGCG